ncbi:MAG TPA: Hsp20/alpha crystallin family protein [Segeticoccus sp.]|uniref:Hsp20/alpha crystallin family protein n=1 Tax=Segeticoccus sp. TaxID=2706531 RepID=UPI002D806439|nr:Hsp20/alpha crystallin family protein [Segeticoccus sp.]HET8599385.1 Hsp20/alpha crystallin family protein [Segeticoccus sp.]
MERMLVTRRDPFSELTAFDAMMRRAFPTAVRPTVGFTPAAEVHKEGEDAVVRLELPGMDLDNDVTVEVDRGRLVVRGERRDERADDTEGRSLREIRYGSFRRSFTLPEHVSADAVSASYDQGVLTVRVAGAYAGTEPRRIAVTSAAPAVESPASEPESEGAEPQSEQEG